MDYSIRRRMTDTDAAIDAADNARQDDYAEARSDAAQLAAKKGYAIVVIAGGGYSVVGARTKARCMEILCGRTPLVEFDAQGEVK